MTNPEEIEIPDDIEIVPSLHDRFIDEHAYSLGLRSDEINQSLKDRTNDRNAPHVFDTPDDELFGQPGDGSVSDGSIPSLPGTGTFFETGKRKPHSTST